MIEFKKLKFGDKVFVVGKTNNCFSKQKITMIDANGTVWSRYDRDHWEYDIKEIEYCGKVTLLEEGNVRLSEDRLDEYHFLWPDGQIYYEHADDDHSDWFYIKEEAEDFIKRVKVANE